MKVFPPMTDEQYAAIVKLIDAGVRASGFQAYVEIALAGQVVSGTREAEDPKDSA